MFQLVVSGRKALMTSPHNMLLQGRGNSKRRTHHFYRRLHEPDHPTLLSSVPLPCKRYHNFITIRYQSCEKYDTEARDREELCSLGARDGHAEEKYVRGMTGWLQFPESLMHMSSRGCGVRMRIT